MKPMNIAARSQDNTIFDICFPFHGISTPSALKKKVPSVPMVWDAGDRYAALTRLPDDVADVPACRILVDRDGRHRSLVKLLGHTYSINRRPRGGLRRRREMHD